jgi:hypothetical protein
MLSLLLASAGLWGGSRLTWFAELRDGGVRGTVLYTENGAQHSSALIPLALLALAGMAGMIATGGWARRVLGVVLGLAGLAACWIAVDGVPLGGQPDGLPIAQMLIARGLAAAGGILLLCGGLAGVKGASVMPRLGARYSAPGAKRVARDPDVELWEALSDGQDPTAAG